VGHSCRGDYIPATSAYSLGECLRDLLDSAARLLTLGGRLVFWMPDFNGDGSNLNGSGGPEDTDATANTPGGAALVRSKFPDWTGASICTVGMSAAPEQEAVDHKAGCAALAPVDTTAKTSSIYESVDGELACATIPEGVAHLGRQDANGAAAQLEGCRSDCAATNALPQEAQTPERAAVSGVGGSAGEKSEPVRVRADFVRAAMHRYWLGLEQGLVLASSAMSDGPSKTFFCWIRGPEDACIVCCPQLPVRWCRCRCPGVLGVEPVIHSAFPRRRPAHYTDASASCSVVPVTGCHVNTKT
jgi:hypothetical protein